jgi:hypothetical protein
MPSCSATITVPCVALFRVRFAIEHNAESYKRSKYLISSLYRNQLSSIQDITPIHLL